MKRLRWVRMAALATVGLVLALLVLAGLAALDNRRLPRASRVAERLDPRERAVLSEVFHLHRALGDSIWPGWARESLAVVLYNERYVFLAGCPDPAPGWIKVPHGPMRGGAWERVPDDAFEGAPYYRQPLPGGEVTPEAFTVRIGDRWAASMETKEWFAIHLADRLRSEMPPALAAVFPLRLAVRVFMGGTAGYIVTILHEAFHAHQGVVAPERLAAAEEAAAAEGAYLSGRPGMATDWQREMELLARGAGSVPREAMREETRQLARRFLAHRKERRTRHGVGAALADYEREREWLEGLAKYVELESWRRASRTPGYGPVAGLEGDRDLGRYAGFEQRWRQELAQMKWSSGDVRFYYSGMAQAAMLDRLMPGWKSRALGSGVWLEDLLAEAVKDEAP